MASDAPLAAAQGPWPWPWDWVGLAGPTASGKSAAAMALAQHISVEIISVDSALVYRGMDVGSAKPSLADQAQVPHHLIDVCDPLDMHSAADFVRAASPLIADIQQRGRLPLLVGGTMLYFKALIDGLDPMPASDAAIRADIAAQAQREGWPAMHALLAKVDPVTAQRLPPMDAQRIGRALEVWRISGKALSAHFSPRKTAPLGSKLRDADGRSALLLSLEPQQRDWLHRRIEVRFDQMWAQGFLPEVLRLRAMPGWHENAPAMRCVGYRQAWAVIDHWHAMGWTDERLLATLKAAAGGDPLPPSAKNFFMQHPEADLRQGLSQWRSTTLAATRQLAKRQLTWLRGMPERTIVACDAPDAIEQVLAQVLTGSET
jgi:tRNA dimethylallyltransferase